ncbi:hypothetical protein HRbin01_01367 [archaeon HR01]|nr:hypothetical protein HRbin01_01367 [archaeon HR01]
MKISLDLITDSDALKKWLTGRENFGNVLTPKKRLTK